MMPNIFATASAFEEYTWLDKDRNDQKTQTANRGGGKKH